MDRQARVRSEELRLEGRPPVDVEVAHERRTSVACREGPRRPVRERAERLYPMGRTVGQALAEIASEEGAADARDEQTRCEARDHVGGPGQQADLLVREGPPGPEQTGDEAAVSNQASIAE